MEKIRELPGIGTINMERCGVLENLDLFLDFEKLSEELCEPVEKAIECGKEIFNEGYAQLMEKQNLHWSDKGVRVLPQLHISVSGFLEKEQKFGCELIVFFEDRENADLSMSVDIDVDLSSYRKVLIDMVTEAFKQEILRMI